MDIKKLKKNLWMELITNFQFLTTVNTAYNKTKKNGKDSIQSIMSILFLFIKSKRH